MFKIPTRKCSPSFPVGVGTLELKVRINHATVGQCWEMGPQRIGPIIIKCNYEVHDLFKLNKHYVLYCETVYAEVSLIEYSEIMAF